MLLGLVEGDLFAERSLRLPGLPVLVMASRVSAFVPVAVVLLGQQRVSSREGAHQPHEHELVQVPATRASGST